MSRIIKDQQKYLYNDFANNKRDRKAKFPKLEECLFLWFSDTRSKHIGVSDEMLIQQAKIFASDMNIMSAIETQDFKFSVGWIDNFKKRYHIKSYVAHGESGSLDPKHIETEQKKFREITAQYKRDDIYNFDETALFYKLEPNKTLSDKQTSGLKIEKDRVTLGFCCNSTGSDKVKPVIIHKYLRPHCFPKSYDPNRFSYYHVNNKA